MNTNMNFHGFGIEPSVEGSGSGRPPGSDFPLIRQNSIYSLTFDEFQTSLGKEFGSMNMEELLKSIWSAEETQTPASAAVSTAGAGMGGGHLQRQGSLTLPRTLSQKTVDEVWKDLAKDFGYGKDYESSKAKIIPQRQPTLGEMTLEEFLVRAGVAREDSQLASKPNSGGLLGDLAQPNNNNTGFAINFQQPNSNGELLNVNGVRSSQQQTLHQQPKFPKQAPVSSSSPMAVAGGAQLAGAGIRGGIPGFRDSMGDGNLAYGPAFQGGGMGMAGLGVSTGSPAGLSSDGLKSNGDTSSVSPVPYVFNGGFRGRKSNSTVEKVIERRQRRMIKNRESAARSRARKQAYTTELEQELARLKEENEELLKKQEKIVEMQKNQAMEMMDTKYGVKRMCLRRTLTGPW